MDSRNLGFGLVGTGMIAAYHVSALRELTGGRLIGVAGRSPERVAAFAAEHQVSFHTTTLDALLARPDIQVVCITTPSGAHLEPALAAIRAGKHVVIEKPLEITTARIDQLLTAARVAGVTVAPIFQARFGRGAHLVKSALEAGRLGRLIHIDLAVKWHRRSAYYTGWKGTLELDGGGVLINQAIHGLDLLQWFAGMPEQVFAWTTRRVHTHIAGEDTATATLRFRDGALGSISATTAAWPGWARRLELCGERGSISLEDDRITRWDFDPSAAGDDEVTRQTDGPDLRSGASAPKAISHAGHRAQLQELVDALRLDRLPALSGLDGRHAVALAEALYTPLLLVSHVPQPEPTAGGASRYSEVPDVFPFR